MVVLAMMLLVAAQAAPTVADIERLPPETAGNVALAGKDHGPIAEVVVRKIVGPEPPGFVQLEMLERATPTAGGCARRRWIVAFNGGTGGALNNATLMGADAGTEVALRSATDCPSSGYVYLNGGLDTAQAVAALAYLEQIRLRRVKPNFYCSDSTASNICASPQTLVRGLAKISPWAVMKEVQTTTFWLGEPGQVVTEVSYSISRPDKITVARKMPAPF